VLDSPEARQTSQAVILTILTYLNFLAGSQDTRGMTLCRCRMAVYVVTKKGVAILAGGFPEAPRGSSGRVSSSARSQDAPPGEFAVRRKGTDLFAKGHGFICVAKGHDFSRAAKRSQFDTFGASAPEASAAKAGEGGIPIR
jgi:hypothetical protein